jgi:hypothetical protein
MAAEPPAPIATPARAVPPIEPKAVPPIPTDLDERAPANVAPAPAHKVMKAPPRRALVHHKAQPPASAAPQPTPFIPNDI